MKYALITPARNEEKFIRETLESMVSQTVLPACWVIVDDGSSDGTVAIIESYINRYEWIELIRRPPRKARNFAGKVEAFTLGLERVRSLQPDLVGNLDADISFGSDHFEFLLQKFAADQTLGVAGTAYTQPDWDSTADSFEGDISVHGACQLFRYECYLDIGGYVANPAGGVDWIAVTTARMKGWTTRNFPERRFHHHRRMGTAERGILGAMFDYGKKDYFLGGAPLWELCRVAYRATKRPILMGGLALLAGYCYSALRREPRPVTPELMQFHRHEQRTRLQKIWASLLRFQRVENFHTNIRDRKRS
jgi:glycosyltransferase involved in cell wall biosynthesis